MEELKDVLKELIDLECRLNFFSAFKDTYKDTFKECKTKHNFITFKR